ncbi:DUF349 domain-containing protein [Paludibacter sp.]|uniref:DUF349 domain-containing protein n=1 Tax=Paludibacter sp. TaxID=1898105 RepID=UPI0025DDBC71|nr:DUF349 domain-containing protein [Paludibacter sp.]
MDLMDDNKAQLPVNEVSKEESIALQETESGIVDQEQENVDTTNNFTEAYVALSQTELVEKLKEVMNKSIAEIEKDEIDAIRQLFYKKNKAEIENQKKAFIENGGEESAFEPEADNNEIALKELLQKYREEKASHYDAIEKEREENLSKKVAILDQLKTIAESGDLGESLSVFRKLQQEWKAIGQVPQAKVNELWKTYNLYMERFYDLIKINNEMRDYDFKKNLEQKTVLCETAEKLTEEKDVVAASRLLQKLHEEWREIGPVARELREELWNRFKNASTVINKKHQEFFASLKAQEEVNLTAKTSLCEQVEAIDLTTLKTYKDWEAKTTEIVGLQQQWKTIGFAPRKENIKIYERFRSACDQFFRSKSEFMKATKAELDTNYEKKKALCEKAESLKDSTDWKATTQIMVDIQKEWKTVGPVQKKYSDMLWKRFVSACDYFFEQKEKVFSSKKSEEHTNLALKKDLIDSIANFVKGEDVQESLTELKALIAKWSTIGHVPFKEKDKIFKAFKDAVNKQMDALNIDAINRKLISFKDNIEKIADGEHPNQLYREREKLLRIYDSLKAEISTYENNMGFISAKSKKSDFIVQELEHKIERLKEERNLIEKKIKLIDESL